VRPHGKIKLGFFPLPIPEAERLRAWLSFSSEFSALDPCVGDGVAFTHFLKGTQALPTALKLTPTAPNRQETVGSKPCKRTPWMCAVRPRHSLSFISIRLMTLKPVQLTIKDWNLSFWSIQYSRNDAELIQEVSNQIALAIKPFMPSVKACLPCPLVSRIQREVWEVRPR
jgi:hypothetical protein